MKSIWGSMSHRRHGQYSIRRVSRPVSYWLTMRTRPIYLTLFRREVRCIKDGHKLLAILTVKLQHQRMSSLWLTYKSHLKTSIMIVNNVQQHLRHTQFSIPQTSTWPACHFQKPWPDPWVDPTHRQLWCGVLRFAQDLGSVLVLKQRSWPWIFKTKTSIIDFQTGHNHNLISS